MLVLCFTANSPSFICCVTQALKQHSDKSASPEAKTTMQEINEAFTWLSKLF